MPVHYNDGVDDPLAYDLTGSFIGGQVSNVRSNLLKQEQFAEAKNMDVDKFGAIITRRGTSRVGSAFSNPVKGLFFYDKPSTEEILAVSGGVLNKSTGGAFSAISGYSPASTANVEFAQLVDKVYMTDGTGNVHSYDGSTVTDEGGTSSDPPTCKHLITHTNRLFAANTENYDDEVAASDLLDGSAWPAVMQFRVGGGEGDAITGICSWYNHNLLVFKNRSIHVVATDPAQTSASNWNVHRIDNTVGCVSGRTIAQAGADVFFLARDGVRTVRTILSGAQSSVSEPISLPINDYIERINWSNASKACATFWNNRYILSVPLDSSAHPNYTLVFNTATGSWNGYWTGWTPLAYGVHSFNDFPKMMFGDNDGNVATWLDHKASSNEGVSDFQDFGSDYESMVLTRGHVFGDYLSPKLGGHVEIEIDNSVTGCHCLELFASLDGVSGTQDTLLEHNISSQSATVTLPVNVPFTLPNMGTDQRAFNLTTKGEFSEIQFRVKSSSGKLHLRSVKASAYINTLALEK